MRKDTRNAAGFALAVSLLTLLLTGCASTAKAGSCGYNVPRCPIGTHAVCVPTGGGQGTWMCIANGVR